MRDNKTKVNGDDYSTSIDGDSTPDFIVGHVSLDHLSIGKVLGNQIA